MIQSIRKDARIRAAENGLILSYTEYIPSGNCYDGLQYVGEKSEIYSSSDEDILNCVKKMISIYKEETQAGIVAAIAKSMHSEKVKPC